MRERLLPWLLLAPALLLATPLSPLAGDPYPHLAGSGLDLIALVPLGLLLLAGPGARLGKGWIFALLFLWAAAVSLPLAHATDAAEARRALAFLALAPLAWAGGATLGPRGRAVFAWGLVGASLAWSIQASFEGLRSGAFGGLLGDSGSLSQAALPGAAVGAGWAVLERGARRWLGLAAVGAFLFHVAAAPVLAGGHTLLAGLLLAAWRGPAAGRGRLAGLALCALMAPFVGMAVGAWRTGTAAPIEGAPTAASHSLGGLGVRGLVWKASLGIVAEHPLVGAGPGQFQAAFPRFRDRDEIELSRHGVCSELDTEVEHAHNDWLLGFLELGLPGGFLLALGLFAAARAAWSRLPEAELLPLAVAALALLVNAGVHAPLSANPASAPLAFALFGALDHSTRSSRRAALAALVPTLVLLPMTRTLVLQGSCLRAYVDAARTIAERMDAGSAEGIATAAREARAALEPALAGAAPSAPVVSLAARIAGPGERDALWERLLGMRPGSVEAWEQTATEAARAGRTADARQRYARALALSPSHPRILRNAARLECTQGDLDSGLALLALLRHHGCDGEDLGRALGHELVLVDGLPARGARLLFARALEELSPEELHARARAEDADAEECLAQLLWGRQHAAAGSWDAAVRSYRQARDRSRRSGEPGAPLYALELAAAELHAGRRAEAEDLLRETPADARAWEELPGWARDTLAALGRGPEAR